MALEAYRHLLRAAGIAFKGDARVLAAARQEVRQRFEGARQLSPDGREAREGVSHAEDVARILRHNVIQGLQEEGPGPTYRLRIHEDIERGDAISVEQATELAKASKQGCWSQ